MNELFLELLNVQSESYKTERMTEWIMDKLFELDSIHNLDITMELDKGNLYVTKGISPDNYYPCIISHTDTVHEIIPDHHYIVVHDDNVAMAYDLNKMELTGIGGDDKVGIYIAMRMLIDLPYCKAAFFRDEEVGCVGSAAADMTFFEDCRFVLQCDRRGNSDFVYSILGVNLYDENFYNDVNPIISKYGYSESVGGLTDVYQLAVNGVGVAVANMSCGYYNPHMPDEMINLADVENCLNMVYEIMCSCDNIYPATHKKKKYEAYKGGKSYSYDNNYYDKWDDWYGGNYHQGANDNKWQGWEYKNGKYTKSIDTIKDDECWSCRVNYHIDDLNEDGMCKDCKEYFEACSRGEEII